MVTSSATRSSLAQAASMAQAAAARFVLTGTRRLAQAGSFKVQRGYRNGSTDSMCHGPACHFEPRTVRRRARRLEGFDEAIVRLYTKGMATR